MTSNPTPDPTHGLTVQQADALWDAVAIPGPQEPTFPVQHERVCRAVAGILDELPAAPSVSAVGQATRDRIAEALAAVDGWTWTPDFDRTLSPVWQGYLKRADAVMPVLPPSADRAAVLLEAADRLWALANRTTERGAGVLWAADWLRRLADEAQQQPYTETPELPYTHTDDDGDTLQIGTVMATAYEGEGPVVWMHIGQHQGDDAATVYVRPERVEQVVTALRAAGRAAVALGSAVEVQPAEETFPEPFATDQTCPNFPTRCPNLRTVDPNPPEHYGGIRCGCPDPEPAS